MFAVTLNEVKAVLKVIVRAGQSGTVNKISEESAGRDDDMQEVKRCKRSIFNNTSQAANKSTKPVPNNRSCPAATQSSVNS